MDHVSATSSPAGLCSKMAVRVAAKARRAGLVYDDIASKPLTKVTPIDRSIIILQNSCFLPNSDSIIPIPAAFESSFKRVISSRFGRLGYVLSSDTVRRSASLISVSNMSLLS